MLDKYILVNPERYNASCKHSMSTGKMFFDFNVKAGSKKELFTETKDILEGLTRIANDFNKNMEKKTITPKIDTKKPLVKGLE